MSSAYRDVLNSLWHYNNSLLNSLAVTYWINELQYTENSIRSTMYISVYVKYKLYTLHQNMHHICYKSLIVKKSSVRFVLEVAMFL